MKPLDQREEASALISSKSGNEMYPSRWCTQSSQLRLRSMVDVGDSGAGVLSGLPLGVAVERRGEAAREATWERMLRASVLAERRLKGEREGRVAAVEVEL